MRRGVERVFQSFSESFNCSIALLNCESAVARGDSRDGDFAREESCDDAFVMALI